MAEIDAYKTIKENYPEIKVYFLTAYTKDMNEKELVDNEYDRYKMNFENELGQLLNADNTRKERFCRWRALTTKKGQPGLKLPIFNKVMNEA